MMVAVNELVDLAEKEYLTFNVDFEKAYDSIFQSGMDYMIVKFDLINKCCFYMCTCILSGNLVLLVNGFSTQNISIHNGLK